MTQRSSKHDAGQLGFGWALLPKFKPATKRAITVPQNPHGVEILPPQESSAITKTEGKALQEKPLSKSSILKELQETVPAEPVVPKIFSVGELTRRISSLLEGSIGTLWVEGEISNLRRQASGHTYFTLKDEEAQLSCVLFARTAAAQAKATLRDGLQVQLFGQISVYQPRGQYQLTVRLVQPRGEGLLQARFEELKRRLAAEGLFDQARKRPLPRFPRRIGVITSPSGAAIRDFLHVLHRRHPGIRVVISPVRVQGKGAAAEIAAAVAEFSTDSGTIGPVDVIVLTRGGGSLEDLWEFNEEVVARAIAASTIPVVSAVGHEIDFSIADFVADLRAPTPSAAAELLAADGGELQDRCRALVARIGREALAALERSLAQEVRLAASSFFRDPLRKLNETRQTTDRIDEMLSGMFDRRMEQYTAALATASAQLAATHPGRQIARARACLESLSDQLGLKTLHRLDHEQGRLGRVQAALSALSPEATLARGFSITRTLEGRVITSPDQVRGGDRLLTQLAGGELLSEIKEVRSGRDRPPADRRPQ